MLMNFLWYKKETCQGQAIIVQFNNIVFFPRPTKADYTDFLFMNTRRFVINMLI